MSTPLRSPLTGLAIYNPDLLRKEDLIVQFVARQSLLELLVDDLRRASASGGIQHHLIIGQRGMGKTTLLRRLRFAIEDDPALSQCWFRLTFPEEQYNITRMSDFWANCLDALGDMLDEQGRAAEAEQFDEAVKNLPDDEPQRSRVALDMLTQWAERVDKRLVLLLDNADLILERLHKYHWGLREVLSHNDRLVFIGAASSSISATYEYEGAFYDFFQVHELRGLNMEETRAVLLKLAELRRTPHVAEIVEHDPGRIQALRVLTGGNTRVLVVLYQVLAQEKDGSVVSELEQILDLHTPYYKAVFEALATQAQQIVGAMCLYWNPITAAELASLPSVRLETNVVSAQLDRLTKDGVVEKAPTPPGEKLLYQVAERFFNIWYLMRASRRLRRKLIWLVDFLKIFYASADLHERARRFLKSEPIPRRADMAFAYAQTVDDPALRHALEYEGIRSILSERREYRKALGSMLDFESDDFLLKTHAERMAELHEIKQRILTAKVDWPDCTAEECWQRLGGSWALSLEEKKDITDRLHTLSEQEIRAILKNADQQQRRLSALLGPERTETLMEAIRSGDMADVTDVEGADAAAIRLSAPSLRAIARIELAKKKPSPLPINDIEEIRQIIALDTDYVYPLYSLGEFFAEHPDLRSEAETCYRKALEISPNHPYLWDGFGDLLADHLKYYGEAEAAYRKAIELDPNFAMPWNDLGALFHYDLQRYDEAEAAYRKAIELAPNDAMPWNNLGNLLRRHFKRYDEAEAAYRKAIELAPNDAMPWRNLSALFHYDLQRYDEAEAAYRKAIELAPNDAMPRNGLGDLLADHLKRYDEAEAAYRKAVDIVPNNDEHLSRLAWCLFLADKSIEEAEERARQALTISPNDLDIIDTLACILARRAKWEEAALMARRFIVEGDENYHSKIWPDVIPFFKEAVKTGHAEDAIKLLDDLGYEDCWRPLREALRAIASRSDAPLLRVAPEVRQPAEELVAQLLPEGVKLASAIKTPREQRSRRKKNV